MDSKKPANKFEEICASEIYFVGEQDGRSERLLKDKLTDFFRRDESVNKAYLAKVNFAEDKNASVVLGLQTQFGPDKGMVAKIGAIFALVFNAEEHLDILFLTDSQEIELTKVCRPFFQKTSKLDLPE